MSKFRVLLPISLAISLLSGNVMAACNVENTEVKITGLRSVDISTNQVTVSYIIVKNNKKDYCNVNSKDNPRAYELIKTAYLTGQPVRLVDNGNWILRVALGQAYY